MWAWFILGCASDGPASTPGDTDTDVATAPIPTADTAPECDGTALCARSIDECGVTLTQAECESFYTPQGGCTDIDSYTSCNCDCIEEPTCDGYFACGQVCFTLYCG